ncbi:MAG: hypothetical protein JWO13_2338 [Acidobacteriales bacterium]|nr:hypothetical protein [Terriglobales bacterium]
MLQLGCAIIALTIGIYYLLCAFLPSLRLLGGTWEYHFPPTAMLVMLPAKPKALEDRPVTRRAFILTGGAFILFGLTLMLNDMGTLADDRIGYGLVSTILISYLAIFLDWLDTRPKNEPSVGGTL